MNNIASRERRTLVNRRELLRGSAAGTAGLAFGGLVGRVASAAMLPYSPLLLPVTGTYTLVVGGSGFGPFDSGSIDYAIQALPVPAPATLSLLAAGLLAVPLLRRA